MAGSKSNYLENLVVNTVIGRSTDLTSSISTALWIALLNSTANDAWTPSDTGECVGANYVRYELVNSTANWTKASTGLVQNKTVVTYTTSASTGWGTIQAVVVCDTSSTGSGNAYYWGDLTSPVTVSAGNVVRFSTGTIRIGEL
jgi:hypothetical protein